MMREKTRFVPGLPSRSSGKPRSVWTEIGWSREIHGKKRTRWGPACFRTIHPPFNKRHLRILVSTKLEKSSRIPRGREPALRCAMGRKNSLSKQGNHHCVCWVWSTPSLRRMLKERKFKGDRTTGTFDAEYPEFAGTLGNRLQNSVSGGFRSIPHPFLPYRVVGTEPQIYPARNRRNSTQAAPEIPAAGLPDVNSHRKKKGATHRTNKPTHKKKSGGPKLG